MQQPLPAEAYNLGAFAAEYRHTFRGLVVSILASILSGALLALSLSLLLTGDLTGLCATIVMAGLLGVSLYYGIGVLLKKGRRVTVFDKGLMESHRGKNTAVRWEDVNELWLAVVEHKAYGVVTTGVTHRYVIVTKDGRRYKYDDGLQNVAQLGDTLVQKIPPLIVTRSLKAFDAGETVSFGKLSLSRSSLAYKKQVIPWSDVANIELDHGVIRVRRFSTYVVSIPVSEIPNAIVVLMLWQNISQTLAPQRKSS